MSLYFHSYYDLTPEEQLEIDKMIAFIKQCDRQTALINQKLGELERESLKRKKEYFDLHTIKGWKNFFNDLNWAFKAVSKDLFGCFSGYKS